MFFKKGTMKYFLVLSFTCLALFVGGFATHQTVVNANNGQLRTAQITVPFNALVHPLPSWHHYSRGNWAGWIPRVSHSFEMTTVWVTFRGSVACTIQHCHAV